MYIVRDKRTREIFHLNPAPLSQPLEGSQVYHRFDPTTMEIGRSDAQVLPEHFHINEQGQVVEFTLQEKVDTGVVELGVRQKVEGDRIVEKKLSEMFADGTILMSPTQKVVIEGDEERVVEKSLSEKVADGLITLEPQHKLVGEEIQEKSVEELVNDDVISRDEAKVRTVQRLRSATETYFEEHRTPSGYRLDTLARQKASFSYPYRTLPDTDETKQSLLDDGLIYPDAVFDEILEEVRKVQAAYAAAKEAIKTGFDEGAPVETWVSVTLEEFFDVPDDSD